MLLHPSPKDKPFEILFEAQKEYSLALARAIEAHCRGEVVPPEIRAICPHHAGKLDAALLTKTKAVPPSR